MGHITCGSPLKRASNFLSITLSASLIPFSGIHSTFYSISYMSGIFSLPAESLSLYDSMTFAKAYFHHPQLNWGFYLAYSAHKKESSHHFSVRTQVNDNLVYYFLGGEFFVRHVIMLH